MLPASALARLFQLGRANRAAMRIFAGRQMVGFGNVLRNLVGFHIKFVDLAHDYLANRKNLPKFHVY